MEEMDGLLKTVGTLGWIIGAFSLPKSAFGIANIMFVTAKKRAAEIGPQKALGAKRRDILLQYVTEASFLSVTGGLGGVAVTALFCAVLPRNVIEISMSAETFATGMATALITGISAGLAPAISAAELQPAEALAGK